MNYLTLEPKKGVGNVLVETEYVLAIIEHNYICLWQYIKISCPFIIGTVMMMYIQCIYRYVVF